MEPLSLRHRIIALLRTREMDARELSRELGIKEKEVYDHLVHVERSAAATSATFILTPSQCLLCGYVFEDRRRLTRPSRCPKCKRSKLQSPSFRIA
ncbi:MAG: transcriptional regulator [Desulfobacterales bacterium]|nr:transcriptional regulator [Desulfobacterales bacterium]